MKKVLYLLILSLSLISCKKDETCWTCTFGVSGGCPPRAAERICSEQEPGGFVDCAGNALSYSCVRE